jgi:hypothetical protein
MFKLYALVHRLWAWLAWFFTGVFRLWIWCWNKVWPAALLMVGVFASMFKVGSAALKLVMQKLSEVAGAIPDTSGTQIPSGWVAAAEFINTVFPLEEAFTFLLGYVALYAIVFVVRFILRHRPRPLGL